MPAIHLSLREELFSRASLPVSTAWLLADCMEFRGKQDLWIRQKPAILHALRQEAMILSVESSNRIEGVTISADRLRPVVLGNARPRDRDEQELQGYRRALDWLFGHKRPIALTEDTLLRLHQLSHAGSSDAGRFKTRDNEIIEIKPGGDRVVRFRPTSAKDTPGAVAALCSNYTRMVSNSTVPPLLLIATAVLDFLCIHPFRDGNGRVSRLLTTLLMKEHGFIVGRYVSLERLVEESKDDYYRVLAECSRGWIDGKNEVLPWWNYFLTIVRRAYGAFAQRVAEAGAAGDKSALVCQAVLSQGAPFTLAQIAARLPGVSPALIKKILSSLRAAGHITLRGRGRGAYWQKAIVPLDRMR